MHQLTRDKFEYPYGEPSFGEVGYYSRFEDYAHIYWFCPYGNLLYEFSKTSGEWVNQQTRVSGFLKCGIEQAFQAQRPIGEKFAAYQLTPEATQMENEQLHVCDGQTYIRREDADTIKWSGSAIDYTTTYNKTDGLWFRSDIRGSVGICFLELHYMGQKLAAQAPTPPQLRLVSRGQSTITGKEVIEIHAYNQSREVWEKLPINANIVSGCYWTLEEILNR